MQIKWFHIAGLVLILGVVLISFPLWTPPPMSSNVSEMPQGSMDVPPVLKESAATVPTDGASLETNLGDFSSLFSGSVPFDEARKRFPDAHPVVATFKSLFTDEQLQSLAASSETRRFIEIIESAEYAEFITTDPTTREQDEFLAKHGIHLDRDRFQKAFREEFPIGEPEDFELEMRQTFTEMFSDADLNNMMQEIINRVPQFLKDSRNLAWMHGYFDGEHGDFGVWAGNILENLDANLPEASFPEDPFLMKGTSSVVEILQETDTHLETVVPDLPAVEKMIETPAPATLNSERPVPDVVDVNQLLMDNSIDTLFAEDSLEKMLNERMNAGEFSTENVQHAMDTLNRYGPEEGLRKLRASNPEVAKQIERIIRERQEN